MPTALIEAAGGRNIMDDFEKSWAKVTWEEEVERNPEMAVIVNYGDETAATLGLAVDRFRLQVFVIGALITGVMVAFSGIIGFVGLMVPHMVRPLTGGDYRRVLPACALFGAVFLLWADADTGDQPLPHRAARRRGGGNCARAGSGCHRNRGPDAQACTSFAV